MEHRVAPLASLAEGGRLLVEVAGHEIGIFRLNGRIYAYENECPHQGGPVCQGQLIGRFEEMVAEDRGKAGEEFSDSEIDLVCPWHGWEYHLEDGTCVSDASVRLRPWRVAVREGQLCVWEDGVETTAVSQ